MLISLSDIINHSCMRLYMRLRDWMQSSQAGGWFRNSLKLPWLMFKKFSTNFEIVILCLRRTCRTFWATLAVSSCMASVSSLDSDSECKNLFLPRYLEPHEIWSERISSSDCDHSLSCSYTHLARSVHSSQGFARFSKYHRLDGERNSSFLATALRLICLLVKMCWKARETFSVSSGSFGSEGSFAQLNWPVGFWWTETLALWSGTSESLGSLFNSTSRGRCSLEHWTPSRDLMFVTHHVEFRQLNRFPFDLYCHWNLAWQSLESKKYSNL